MDGLPLTSEPGFAHAEAINIEGQTISILPLSYFLATKFTAFKDRGGNDPRTSHDLEDITYVLDNRTDLIEIVVRSPEDVLPFIKEAFAEIVKTETIQEAIMANLFYETQTERFEMIMDKLNHIISA